MKVLLVTEPGVDGVFRYVEALCHYLDGEGVGVNLAYSDRRGSDRLPKLVAWVEQRGGRTTNLRTGNHPAPADFRAFWSLLRLAREVRPDVVHSHSSKAGVLARLLPLGGIRAVQFYHPHAYVGMRPKRAALDPLYNLVEAVLGRTAHTISVSSDERAFACERLKIPPERVNLLHNGVDTEIFSPAGPEEKRRLRAELGLPPEGTVLGFMGRASAQKDPVTLYRAFARAAADRPVILFHIGRGELDPQLERLVAELGLGDRIIRRPYMSRPADFYRVVDGFILTSRYEGFSLAALEALSADLPLILSEAPGITDLLARSLSHAWKAAPGDVDGFARGITAWHDRLAAGTPPNHRLIARSQFDLREKNGAVLALYRKAVSGAGLARSAIELPPSPA
ncbi:MAG TPA: glycosyltransferase family 4 protein [Opitutaceae bacterium]|nr:glycosyltransferase family 4 protein [Opitutaceae bacterium]